MTEIDRTRTWLALEHEAIWTYGLVGARVEALADAARAAIRSHESTRDRLAAALAALGGAPVAPRSAYAVPVPTDVASARALARDVEARIAAACLGVVEVTADEARDRAVAGLRAAARACVRWGATPEPFPGLD